MIGQFIFMSGAPSNHIVLHMGWRNNTPVARVHSPDMVIERLRKDAMDVRDEDEYMNLPIALGYAVLLAGLSETGLVVSGDRSAWPDEWGELQVMQPHSVALARSH